MIIRIFRITIHPELREEFERDFSTISVSAVEDQRGFISYEIGRPTRWNPDEYAMISRWKDETSLEAFVGRNWNVAVIPPGMERYAHEYSVVHFETVILADLPGSREWGTSRLQEKPRDQ
jgi:heme-degrading monooxygenase HmoA